MIAKMGENAITVLTTTSSVSCVMENAFVRHFVLHEHPECFTHEFSYMPTVLSASGNKQDPVSG